MLKMHSSLIYLSVLPEKIAKLRVFIALSIVFFILLPKQLFGYTGTFKLAEKIRYTAFEISIAAISLHLLCIGVSNGAKAGIVHLL